MFQPLNPSFAALTRPNTSKSGVLLLAPTEARMPLSLGRRNGFVSSSSPSKLGTVGSPCTEQQQSSAKEIFRMIRLFAILFLTASCWLCRSQFTSADANSWDAKQHLNLTGWRQV
jgi:hypothetical protein